MDNPFSPERRPIVLVVDDETVVRDFIKHILEADGYEVLTAGNSVEALQLGAAFRGTIDLLLTDVHMKIFQNGIQLARCFNTLRPETRILLTSGSAPQGHLPGDGEDRWPFLPKPFTRKMLLDAVESLAPQVLPVDWESLAAV